MVESVNPGFLLLGQNHYSPRRLRNWITLAISPGKQQQVWKGHTKGKNATPANFILARKESSGILTSFLLVFITSNIPLLQIQVSAMNYTPLDGYMESGVGLHSIVIQYFNFIQHELSLVNAYIVWSLLSP